jgi:endo-1,4-beta-xylanase
MNNHPMGKYLLGAAVVSSGVLSVACAGHELGGESGLAETALAVNAEGKRPLACKVEHDPAFALPNEACRGKRLIGAAVDANALAGDAAYASTLTGEFSYVTPENALKWGFVQPTNAQSWDFAQADAIVAAAEAAGQDVKGHTLIWHAQLPAFVSDALTAKELKQLINANIDTVVGRYRGVIRAWDVVNEAIADDGSLRDTVFSRKFGADYIAHAFRRAHAADKKAKLIYNDYGTETINAKSDAVYELVSSLLCDGVPLDGVGFQMHLDARFAPSKDAIAENFARFAELGLSINVSELDVQVAGLAGTRAEKLAIQQQIYQRVVAACVATPACEAVTTWGFTDRYSWIDSTVGPDDPLEFDDAIARKPAYYGMVDGFAGLEPDAVGTPPNLIANGSFEAGTDGWFGLGIPSVAVGKREHTGRRALLATGRTDTWQGPGTNVTPLVQSGWTYGAKAWASIKGAPSAGVRLTAKITCEGEAATFVTIASATATRGEYTELSGELELPLCELAEVLVYAEGPAAGVDLLVDDVTLRPLSEPLGPNALTNGDFESGVSGWVAWAGTLSASSVAHGGSGSAIVTNRTDTWQGPVYDLLPAATKGATYRFDGFARIAGAASAPVSMVVASTCDGTTSYAEVGSATGNDHDFVALSGSYQIPTCNLTGLFFYFQGPPAGVDLIVDDVSVQQRLSIPVVLPPPPPAEVNLAGNGGFELGTQTWFGFGASAAQTTAFVHSGAAAGVALGRTDTWQGIATNVPNGPATYKVGLYALQSSGAAVTLALSSKLTCNGVDSFGTIASASADSGAWKLLEGTLTVPAGCSAAVVYVQQFGGATFPDLYVDDLVVSPIAVTNFSGNPGFETGTGGWFAYGPALTQVSDFVHGGAFAGLSSGRSAEWMGPAFAYPTGAGTYAASLHALQNSGSDLPFILSAKLTCGGVDSFPTVAAATGPSGSWVSLAGTFTVPPGCTTAEIFLHQNGGSTFPNIYVDDLIATPAP